MQNRLRHGGLGGIPTVGQSSGGWSRLLSLEYTSRSGLDLLETRSGDNLNAKIIPTCAKLDGSNYLTRTTANFGSAVTDATGGYIEARVYYNGSSTPIVIFASGDNSTAIKHFYVGIVSGKPRIKVANQSPLFATTYVADNAISTGWHTIKFISSGGAYSIQVDGSTVAGTAVGTNDGKWIGNALDRDNVSIGIMVYNSTTYASQEHYIDYVDFNGTNKWYLTGLGKYEFDVGVGHHLTWTGSAHQIFDPLAGQYILNTGYSVWTKAGEADEYVPYSAVSTPYNAGGFLSGYAKESDFAGSSTLLIKKALALIGFNETSSADSKLEIFDRSNTTRQEDVSRSSDYYDDTSLATKSRYHSSEICYLAMIESLFKIGYKHIIFPVNEVDEDSDAITGWQVYKEDQL